MNNSMKKQGRNVVAKRLFGAWMLLAACLGMGTVQAQTVEYIHTDALGTSVAVTDANRNVIERSEYEPYGALLNRPISDGPGYTGHVMDAATGLTYMQQRYYDPTLGRFLSSDPVAAREAGDNFNRYSYAFNNPYLFNDPDGRENKLGIVATFTGGFERAATPTARDTKVLNAAQRSVDLTVNAALASNNASRISDAKMWDVTANPDLTRADVDGIAYTGTTNHEGKKTAISTEFTGDIVDVVEPNSGPHSFTDGLTSNGGDATLFQIGAHELGHGSDVNVAISSEAASERDAGNQVLDQLKSSPDIKESEIRRTR